MGRKAAAGLCRVSVLREVCHSVSPATPRRIKSPKGGVDNEDMDHLRHLNLLGGEW